MSNRYRKISKLFFVHHEPLWILFPGHCRSSGFPWEWREWRPTAITSRNKRGWLLLKVGRQACSDSNWILTSIYFCRVDFIIFLINPRRSGCILIICHLSYWLSYSYKLWTVTQSVVSSSVTQFFSSIGWSVVLLFGVALQESYWFLGRFFWFPSGVRSQYWSSD